MEDVKKQIARVEAEFKQREEEWKFHTTQARTAQMEMLKLQGEYRALKRFLPAEEA